MNERDKKSFRSILRHIEVVFSYVKDITSIEQFENNSIVQDAVVFNLLQVGEIAKSKLSDDIKSKYPDIPWKGMYGFRNRLVHDYENIVLTVVYEVIKEDLLMLKETIYAVLESES